MARYTTQVINNKTICDLSSARQNMKCLSCMNLKN